MITKFYRKLTQPPKLQTDNIDKITKYTLAYCMTLFLFLSVTLMSTSMIISWDSITFIVLFASWISLAVGLVYIRRTGDFFTPTLIFNIIALVVCELTLYFVPNQPQTVPLFWTIIHILFSFFVLGVRFGVIFTSIHAISFTYYNLFHLQDNLNLLSDLSSAQIYSTTLYIFLSFGLIAFLGWQNFHSGEFSKSMLTKAKTEMQEQYDVISKQSEEKTVMLKEIHHRVKNNLQIITSLLRLQSRELESPEAIAKFKDATHRVIAMSMIHEKMYQNDALSSMHLREYLYDLSKDLISSYQADYEVKLEIECNVETIGLRSVVPLALILNELISNTLKYAFDDDKNCVISISFMYLSAKNCKLVYKDSGTWKPPSRKGSFGLDLIESLTYQLEGSLRTETHPETLFEFIIAPEIDEDPSRFDSAKV